MKDREKVIREAHARLQIALIEGQLWPDDQVKIKETLAILERSLDDRYNW